MRFVGFWHTTIKQYYFILNNISNRRLLSGTIVLMVDDIRDKRLLRLAKDDPDDEPSFVPPEKVAENEEVIDMAELGENQKSKIKDQKPDKGKKPAADKKKKKPGKVKTWLADVKFWFGKRSKKQKIAMLAGTAIGLGLVSFGIYSVLTKAEPSKPAPVVEKKEEVKEPPKPTTEPSKLTGVPVSPELNQLPVTAIMIENSPDARPQSGLNDAGVVFEAIAEGGITRFLTLFQETQPDYIGPVRSVRPYYLDWLKAFDAAVAHVGGSGEALARIRNEGIKDLDQSFNGGAFQRISSRYAPHNVYTSMGSLLALQKSKGFNAPSVFTGFARKAEKAIVPTTAKAIDLAISGPLYNVHYDYDVATNSYKRVLAGKPHIDERSGLQLNPKVVIAIVIPYSIHPNGVNSAYGTIGSGKAYIFQDGGVTEGTWSKASDKDQILFGDAHGAPIGINPGQTWLSMVSAPTNVTYQP